MRIIAIIATYNEERFIGGCLEHLFSQGVEAYLCDNDSTDSTVAIATRYLGSGLCGIERIPRDGIYRWRAILGRKEELAATLEADWFIHMDPDEMPLPPPSGGTLAEAIGRADAGGFNAVELTEFVFVPTREAPDHDHANFQQTMHWYYPFAPTALHRLHVWKRQPTRVDLVSSGGHTVAFPGRRIYPELFRMRHYVFLSYAHVLRKYVGKRFDPDELRDGWHGWRATLTPDQVRLPSETQLRYTSTGDDLDFSDPRTAHWLAWT